MKSRLRKGEIAEALFVAKALSLGMNVSKPFGQNCRYDFMVEVMGRVSRVQVKSTWRIGNWTRRVDGTRRPCRNAYIVRCGGSGTHGQSRYRLSDLDYIAAYIGLEDEWFIIPLARVHTPFYIVLPGRYARYREAWDLLCPKGTYVGDIQAAADPRAGGGWQEAAKDSPQRAQGHTKEDTKEELAGGLPWDW
ncbi:MAG TPA: group I intron-associated PD-(D/E)XK endonuclease [Terriglobales bacterium]|nr:group I intron-associated PD-(D/E)XK endonuclease [Terriglobales bacterium]